MLPAVAVCALMAQDNIVAQTFTTENIVINDPYITSFRGNAKSAGNLRLIPAFGFDGSFITSRDRHAAGVFVVEFRRRQHPRIKDRGELGGRITFAVGRGDQD